MIYIDGIISVLQRSGGISVCFDELLKKLEENNSDFKLINYGSNLALDASIVSKNKIVNKSVKYSSILRYVDVTIPEDEQLVFHSSYYRLPKSRNQIKIVTTVHDFVYERYMNGIKRWLHQWQKRRAILASDVVICISESTKSDLLKFIPEAKNKDLRVIYNGVSPSFSPIEISIDNPFDDQSKGKFLLYVGSRFGYKNFKLLVRSLQNLTEFNLVLVGGGNLDKSEYLLLEQHLPGRYKHHEFVSITDLNYLYNMAFCFVYPSSYEGFGIPAIEAMQAGCPVIAMNYSSLPEVCGDAAILLDSLNEHSLLESLESLKSLLFRDDLVNKGFSNAKRFSWEINTKQILSIYSELLGEK
jgi:mannosyltransferase